MKLLRLDARQTPLCEEAGGQGHEEGLRLLRTNCCRQLHTSGPGGVDQASVKHGGWGQANSQAKRHLQNDSLTRYY